MNFNKAFFVTILMALIVLFGLAQADDCDKCGPTTLPVVGSWPSNNQLIGCRKGRCYYKCTRRCLGKDNKFYYEAVKFNLPGI